MKPIAAVSKPSIATIRIAAAHDHLRACAHGGPGAHDGADAEAGFEPRS